MFLYPMVPNHAFFQSYLSLTSIIYHHDLKMFQARRGHIIVLLAKKMARANAKDFFLLLLLQFCSLQLAASNSVVKYLPGFDGPLPFYLETGYVGVGESENVQLFYYFVKSERNPAEDPVLLWLTGGPGCSALSGLLYEIGPLHFQVVEYNGSLPTLILNPDSWTKVSSIIFVDLPVGTGFSYARTAAASQTGDFIQVRQADQFLRKWLTDHPDLSSNPVYVGGDSYSGITVPAVASAISNGNEKGGKPLVNLKGYLVGNGYTDPVIDGNAGVAYAHGMGLISDELYQSLKSSCKGQYQFIDPGNARCLKHMQSYYESTSGLNKAHILEPHCEFASPRPFEISAKRRSLNQKSPEFLNLPTINCRTYGYLLVKYWVDDNNVREALHVRQGSVENWIRCNNGIPFTHDIGSSTRYHVYLGKKGYRSLIYSGDHDMLVPFLGTQAWIRSLTYFIVDDWRPWKLEGQVSGYTRTYANRMTFATVKGGGHTAPEYRPPECFAMFQRWIDEEPL